MPIPKGISLLHACTIPETFFYCMDKSFW
jgi:hypothetical protein